MGTPNTNVVKTGRQASLRARKPQKLATPNNETGLAESIGKRSLLDAAAIEFSTRGYDGASVGVIAERAGVKQPLVNYHFGGKEGLWRAVIEEGYRDTIGLALSNASVTDDDPVATLKHLLKAFAGVSVRRPWIHSIVHKEMMSSGPRLDWLVDTYVLPLNKQLAARVEGCIASGFFKPVSVDHALVLLTGSLISFFNMSALPKRVYGSSLKGPEAAHAYVETTIDILFNGLRDRHASDTDSVSKKRSHRKGG